MNPTLSSLREKSNERQLTLGRTATVRGQLTLGHTATVRGRAEEHWVCALVQTAERLLCRRVPSEPTGHDLVCEKCLDRALL